MDFPCKMNNNSSYLHFINPYLCTTIMSYSWGDGMSHFLIGLTKGYIQLLILQKNTVFITAEI